MAVPPWLKRILGRHGVAYQEFHHPPVHSALRLAETAHMTGYRVAKTVFVWVRGRPVSVVLPASARLDLARVQIVLGDPECRLASEPEIVHWFKGCDPGCVPPFHLRRDQRMLMDRSLACLGRILIPAGTPEDAVLVRFRDWWRIVSPGVGRFAASETCTGRKSEAPTVLVVEDETDTNDLLCRLLEREGFTCRGVEQGGQAVALASEICPSAILLDLMLPDISGFDVYERLRRARSLQHTPILIVTALDDEKSRQRGVELGADAYLTKPFPPRTLVAELQAALADAHA